MNKIKVALDKTPTISAHRTRGIGNYTANLITELKKRQGIELILFDNPKSPPVADVVHYPYFDLFNRSLLLNLKSKTVVTIHDVIPLIFPRRFPVGIKGRVNLFLQKLALKNCEAIICDSEQSKKDVIGKLGVPSAKVHVTYLAPSSNFKEIKDKDVLASVSKKYKLPDKFVLYVGDVNWNKNIHNLLKAVQLNGCSIVLVGQAFVSPTLKEAKEIDDLIENLNLAEKVVKTGFVEQEDLVAIYSKALCTVMPSYYEGFGLPILESMSCQTPVICSNNSSIKEIVNGAAIFCDPHSPQDIAEKIAYVLNLSQKDILTLKTKSLKNALKFSWPTVAKQTAEIYQLIASAK
jgi:glycosyltransferase involved in cell wall biosynthesis